VVVARLAQQEQELQGKVVDHILENQMEKKHLLVQVEVLKEEQEQVLANQHLLHLAVELVNYDYYEPKNKNKIKKRLLTTSLFSN
jgi:hypothetical protein